MKAKGIEKAWLSKDGDILFADETKQSDVKFAMFGGKTEIPTLATENDFVFVDFRQLSAAKVGSGTYKSTDFSKNGVLQAALPLFKGKTVYQNHDTVIGNHVGVIGEAKWQEETTNAEGKTIPAGINAPFIIDKVLRPELVRELTSPYSPIRACSVGISFEWEASHEFENEWRFMDMLGEIVDGEEVRRMVTKIVEIYECSLVWEGADPFAKKIGTDGRVSLSKEAYIAKKQEQANYVNNKKDSIMEIKNLKTLFAAEKIEEIEAKAGDCVVLSKEEFAKKDDVWKSLTVRLQKEVDALKEKAEKADLQAEQIAKLEAKVAENEKFAAFGKEAHESRVKEAERLYLASIMGGTPNEAMLADIRQSSFEVLAAKIELFGGKAESFFTRTCNDCGSQSVSLKASKQPEIEAHLAGKRMNYFDK